MFGLGKLLVRLGVDATGFEKGLNKAKAKMKTARNDIGSNLNTLKNGFMNFGALLTGIFAASITIAVVKANEFQQGLRDISTIAGLTKAQLKDLGGEITRIAAKTQTKAVELAAAQYQILSAGITDSAQALRTLENSAKLAKAGLSSTAEAANIVTSAMNAFGVSSQVAADVIFKTVQLGKTTVAGLSASFGTVAGIAATAGVSIQELSAATAALTITGKSAAEAQTGLRAILTAVAKQSKQSVDLAKELGIEFSIAGIKAKGFAKWLKEVADKSGRDEEVLAKLFGRVEALTAVIELGGERAADFAKNIDLITDSAGANEEGFKKQLNVIDKLIVAWDNFINTSAGGLLEKLEPALGKTADAFEFMTNAMIDNQGIVDFTLGVTGATVAITAFIAAVLLGPPAVATLTAAVGALAVAIGISTGGLIFVIGALVTIVGVWAKALGDTQRETDLAKRSVNELTKKLDKNKQAFADTSKKTTELAKKYDELISKAKLTAEEHRELAKVTRDLSSTFGVEVNELRKLITQYGTATKKAREFIIAKAAASRTDEFNAELAPLIKGRKQTKKRLKQAERIARSPLTFDKEKARKNLKEQREIFDKSSAQIEFLKDKRKNVISDLEKQLDKINEVVTDPLTLDPTGGGNGKSDKEKTDAEKEQEKAEKRAKAIQDGLRSIFQVEKDGIAESKALLDRGLLSLEDFDKRVKQLQKDTKDKIKIPTDELKQSTSSFFKFAVKGLTDAGVEASTAIKKVNSDWEKATEKAKQEALGLFTETRTAAETYEVKLKELIDLQGQFPDIIDPETFERAKLALQELRDESESNFDEIKGFLEGFGQKFEDSVISAFKDGKFNAKEFFASILEDLARLIIKLTITIPLVEALVGLLDRAKGASASKKGGGFGSALLSIGGSILGGIAGGSVPNSLGSAGLIADPFKAFTGFADGGTPAINQDIIVGEEGPEIIKMGSLGQVIPNNELSGIGGGGGSVTQTFNIKALDGKSVREMLANEKSTIQRMATDGIQHAYNKRGRRGPLDKGRG